MASKQTEQIFNERLAECYDELKWLYMELYHDEHAFLNLSADDFGVGAVEFFKTYAVGCGDAVSCIAFLNLIDVLEAF